MFVNADEKQTDFLDNLATKLNYQRHSLAKEPFVPQNKVNKEHMQGLSQDELCQIAQKQSADIYTDFKLVTKDNLAKVLEEVITAKESGKVIVPNDQRFAQYDLTKVCQAHDTYVWQAGEDKRTDNIQAANQANVGIAFGEYLLAESATMVLETNPGHGRSLHFLPQHFIAIVPKSQIVPRITQATQAYNQKVLQGEKIGTNLSFISGPSNSGDIEMILVVGVHGPLSMTYLVIEDA